MTNTTYTPNNDEEDEDVTSTNGRYDGVPRTYLWRTIYSWTVLAPFTEMEPNGSVEGLPLWSKQTKAAAAATQIIHN